MAYIQHYWQQRLTQCRTALETNNFEAFMADDNVDLFLTGSNAVTESGILVNLDMIGNRVAALIFGPKYVLIVVGRNKLVPDLERGMARVKNVAAPLNAIRHNCKTPCVTTSFCHDCQSPDRICNTWMITEKAYPKGRIKVVLINEDLGL